jgi:hypothetical protein
VIWVVGCNHGIQPRDPDWLGGDAPEAADQKRHFSELLEKIISECRVDFVGEEWGLPDVTTACYLAGKYGATWVNINTCQEDLKQMGIPRDYVAGPYTNEQKESWNRKREQAILANIKGKKGSAERLLIICGFEHLQRLSTLLVEIETIVTPCDYRILPWFRHGMFPENDLQRR